MKKAWWILTLFVTGLTAMPAMAALQSSVDRNPVSLNESFTLTLESDDNLNGTPDLSVLQQDFEVINQGKSSSFQFINGNTSRSIRWSITLMAKHSGQIQIPPITIGNEQSPPINLTVNAAATPTPSQGLGQQGDIFLEASATPTKVYVQQQIVYTVRLFHRVNLGNNATLTEPKLPGDDAIIEKLGDDKNYQTTRNGIRYAVVERRYALYPQHAGKIEIPALVFEGDVVQASANSFFNFDPFATNSRHLRAVSSPVTVSAQAAPATFHGKSWLPARSLQLVEQWSPDPPHFSVGQPITRTVAVMADGLTAAQLPTLSAQNVEGIKQYPDQPSLKDTKASDGITGIRSEKTALIPMHPGAITLPAIAIPWWNTTTDKVEIAHLPARTVTVAPPAGNSAVQPTAPTSTATPASTQPSPPIEVPKTKEISPASAVSGFWPWVALVLALGWLITAIAWWRSVRRPAPQPPSRHAEKPSLNQLERQLKSCCLANDMEGSSRALLAWARQRWPEQPPVSLTALAGRCPPALAQKLSELDRARYAPSAMPWQGAPLWQQFDALRKKRHKPSSRQEEALRPLYSE